MVAAMFTLPVAGTALVTLAIIAAIVIIGLHLWRSNRRHRRERD